MITGIKQKLDYDDYAGIPPDRNRYEIIEGELYVTPAPSPATDAPGGTDRGETASAAKRQRDALPRFRHRKP